MTLRNRIELTELNLQRKLDWISRSDTRIAFTASIAVAMLGVLASASALITKWENHYYLVFALAFLFLFGSLLFVYFSQFPKTKSVNSSLIYFGTIANLKVDDFNKKVRATTEDEYLDDLLSQTHRNAEILRWKFNHLRTSLI